MLVRKKYTILEKNLRAVGQALMVPQDQIGRKGLWSCWSYWCCGNGAGGEDVWVSGDPWGVDKEYCDVVNEYRGVAGAGIGVVSDSCDGGVGWADYEDDGDAEDNANGPDCAIKKSSYFYFNILNLINNYIKSYRTPNLNLNFKF